MAPPAQDPIDIVQALIASLMASHFNPKHPRESKIGHIVCGLCSWGSHGNGAVISRQELHWRESTRLPATGTKQGLTFGLIFSEWRAHLGLFCAGVEPHAQRRVQSSLQSPCCKWKKRSSRVNWEVRKE